MRQRVVGSLFDRPFLGSFLGFLGGIIAADAARSNPDNYVVAKPGTKVGALFQAEAPLVSPPRISDDQDSGAPANAAYEVRVGDNVLNFPTDEHPYWSGDILMVPLSFTAHQTRVSVDWSGDRGIRMTGANSGELHLSQDSDDFTLNGTRGTLPAPVQVHNRITYVPVDVFGWVSDRGVFVNGDRLPNNP